MSAEATLQRLRELHHGVEKLRCGARTTKVVTHYHGNTEERELVCTKDPHPASEPHKDAICCWRFHEFEEGDPSPEDVWHGKNCSCGHYECATRAILEEVDEEPELQWRVRDTAWGGDRMGTEDLMRRYQQTHSGVLEHRRKAGPWTRAER